MTQFDERLQALKRPKLLVHAARIGAALYRPERDLRRIKLQYHFGNDMEVLPQLFEKEAEIEDMRRKPLVLSGKYDPARHIELLAAIICEVAATQSQADFRPQ